MVINDVGVYTEAHFGFWGAYVLILGFFIFNKNSVERVWNVLWNVISVSLLQFTQYCCHGQVIVARPLFANF